MFTITVSQAQSKKDIENDLKNCNSTKDSIQTELTDLSAVYDSIYQTYVAYDSMYTVVVDRVIKYDFDPENMSDLIDSLRTEASLGSTALHDSIAGLQEENAKLKASLEEMDSSKNSSEEQTIESLKKLKQLLDDGILTEEEFNAKKTELLKDL
jgi:hypothetical protein